MLSLDEFVGGGEARSPSPLQLEGGAWQSKLAALTRNPPAASDLALPSFTLLGGGDLFVSGKNPRKGTPRELLELYQEQRIELRPNGAAREERDAALAGTLRVLRGNPAICRRMLLAKPIKLAIIPRGRDFRSYGFPPSTNPRAAGIFWSSPREADALIGLREEWIVPKPWLMIHEMAHAVHLLGMTEKERAQIDQSLLPVYRSRSWVEEAVAIYAERSFGAKYTPEELASPDLYGQTRRSWSERAVFALFIDELLRPKLA